MNGEPRIWGPEEILETGSDRKFENPWSRAADQVPLLRRLRLSYVNRSIPLGLPISFLLGSASTSQAVTRNVINSLLLQSTDLPNYFSRVFHAGSFLLRSVERLSPSLRTAFRHEMRCDLCERRPYYGQEMKRRGYLLLVDELILCFYKLSFAMAEPMRLGNRVRIILRRNAV